MENVLKQSLQVDEFVTRLIALGRALEKAYPRQADDINELSDEIVVLRRRKGWGL